MNWKEIKNENVVEYYYKNSSEEVHLNSKIEIQFNKYGKVSSFQMEIENQKIFENYLIQLKSNKKLKLSEKKNSNNRFVSADLKYEFILFKESNEIGEVYYVVANRLEKN